MKIVTILGTRPEIIRLSRVIEKLDGLCDHRLVHTGQNFEPVLSEVFFEQLGVRRPDHELGIRAATFGHQVGQILAAVDEVLDAERPDAVLILGDTNSGLSAIVAKRRGIPVYHMEAGNRCYDDRVPEEINRRIIDHSSDVLMPYTERSRQNLLREGIAGERVYVTGNPILEVITHNEAAIQASTALERQNVRPQEYFLVTMHRAENVDPEVRLTSLVRALRRLAECYGDPIIVSTHPRTRARLEEYGITGGDARLQFVEPLGFFDFVSLERQARCVISDSGTVQEECAIFGVPNVTIRETTERPETLECGSNILSGVASDRVLDSVRVVMSTKAAWAPPHEYLVATVSQTVAKIILSYHH